MSATSTKSLYPHLCSACQGVTGLPYSAGTCDRPGIIVVKLRCQQCGHEWIADAPQPSMASEALWPKRPDRGHHGPRFGSL